MDFPDIISNILRGDFPDVDTILAGASEVDTDTLADGADTVRKAWCENRLDTCSIVNARSGRCSEDCKWCAQSRHFVTGVDEYDIVSPARAMEMAEECVRRGVNRLSLVTSGRCVTPGQLGRFCEIFRHIHAAHPSLKLCASMGLLDFESMQRLRDAGVSRYHCNLETSADYFPTLCTTHSHTDKLATIGAAARAGLSVCSGGIIGMGETMRQRLLMVREATEAGAVSIPLNILCPIPGTPLADMAPLPADEIVRSGALMRLAAPKAVLRFAGGRRLLPRQVTLRMLRGGVNGVMIGDLLTTTGNSVTDDCRLLGATDYETTLR